MKRILSLFFFLLLFSFASTRPVSADTIFSYSGVLRNGLGVPVPNVNIILASPSKTDSQTTDNSGAFSLHVPSGTYDLVIVPAGVDTSVAPGSFSADVPGIVVSGDVQQDLVLPTKTLTVTIIDSLGQVVTGAAVRVRAQANNILPFTLFPGGNATVTTMDSRRNTDSFGVTHLALLPSSTFDVFVTPPSDSNLAGTTVTMSFLEDTSTTITLPAVFSYSGILRNGAGTPIPNINLTLGNDKASNSSQTASDGSFTLHVPDSSIFGAYTLTIPTVGSVDPSIAPSSMNAITSGTVVNTNTVQDLTLPTKTLTVIVLDVSGKPLSNTHIHIQSQDYQVSPFYLFEGAPDTIVFTTMISNLTTDVSGIARFAWLLSSSVSITVTPSADSGLQQKQETISFQDNTTVTISYQNQAPVVSQISGTSINESSTYNTSGFFADSDSSSWMGTVNYGDGSGAQPLSLSGTDFNLNHVYKDNGVYTIAVNVTDNQGATGTETTNVSVNNVAPVVSGITGPTDPAQVNTTINTNTSFSDDGVLDAHSAVWNWGDNTTSAGTVNETNGSGTVTGSHTYTAAGVYTVNVTVTDDDNGSGQPIDPFQYVVVYDPSAGFVTGAGTITSPLGAYTPNPLLTGKAIFGFVSRYQNGANVPTGSTQFRFVVANFVFQSTSYDWLVVGGPKAQYKGSGTINGSGDFGFILSAIDGQINGGGGTDKFRIKVYDKTTSVVIYDNQMAASDTADPSTIIDSGSITIHP